jgi:hypothetical protein
MTRLRYLPVRIECHFVPFDEFPQEHVPVNDEYWVLGWEAQGAEQTVRLCRESWYVFDRDFHHPVAGIHSTD